MKRLVISTVLLASLAAAAPNVVSAQTVDPHEGLWFSAGIGYGALGCGPCDGRDGAGSGQLSVGGTLSDEVLLGAGLHVWTDSQNDVTLTAGLLTAMARGYAAGGLYFTGGLGIGMLDADFAELGGDSETGFGVMLGVGYDFRVSPGVSITPYATGYSVETEPLDTTVYSAGIALTLH